CRNRNSSAKIGPRLHNSLRDRSCDRPLLACRPKPREKGPANQPPKGDIVVFRTGALAAAMLFAAAPAFAADKYETDIGPTPKNGSQGANVQGRGTVLATLNKNTFTIQGKFAGLSSPATQARLHMGNVMGGIGPAIGDLKIAQAQSGEISGTFTLT